MGLDMYIRKETYLRNRCASDRGKWGEPTQKTRISCVGYWRKARNIHDWICEKTGLLDAGGDTTPVDDDLLKELRDICRDILKEFDGTLFKPSEKSLKTIRSLNARARRHNAKLAKGLLKEDAQPIQLLDIPKKFVFKFADAKDIYWSHRFCNEFEVIEPSKKVRRLISENIPCIGVLNSYYVDEILHTYLMLSEILRRWDENAEYEYRFSS